jgi:CheY-like chemotaxis protein
MLVVVTNSRAKLRRRDFHGDSKNTGRRRFADRALFLCRSADPQRLHRRDCRKWRRSDAKGQNGFQVTRAISRDPQTQHIPIIICTSKDQETDRYWGMKQGAKDYIVKPVNPQDLLDKIQSYAS